MTAQHATGPARTIGDLLPPDAADEVRRAGYGHVLTNPTLGAWRRRHGITPDQAQATCLAALADEMVNELRRWDCLDRLAYVRAAIIAGAAPCAIAYRLRELAGRLDPDPDRTDRPACGSTLCLTFTAGRATEPEGLGVAS
jgi:hypothetical protein